MEQRRHFRKDTQKEGKVEVPGVMLVGTILDESAGGVFFRPEAGVFLGTFTQLDCLPEQLPPTCRVRISARLRPNLDRWANYDAVVQWRGYSKVHACTGMGISLTRKSSSSLLDYTGSNR